MYVITLTVKLLKLKCRNLEANENKNKNLSMIPGQFFYIFFIFFVVITSIEFKVSKKKTMKHIYYIGTINML